MNKTLCFILGLILGLAIVLLLPKSSNVTQVHKIVSDTIYDTVLYDVPITHDSCVIRYETHVLPIYKDTIIQSHVVVYDTMANDSTNVVVPITQKHYKENEYDAWVSGFNPNLDSIKLYRPTINNTIHVREKEKRFGVGVVLGYGATKDGLSPYVGVGVTYSLFKF